jgi:voltage-gated potassium channel
LTQIRGRRHGARQEKPTVSLNHHPATSAKDAEASPDPRLRTVARELGMLSAAALKRDPDALTTLRRRICDIIEIGRTENRVSRIFDTFIVTLIILNIAAFVLETVPAYEAQYWFWFKAFEIFSILVFTAEYALRIWTAVDIPFLSRKGPWGARLAYARRPSSLIDLAAILPFYLSFIIPIDGRIVRILRLLRFFKLSRYSPAIHTLMRVLAAERRSLAAAALLLIAALLISSTGMYYIENGVADGKFKSVPDAMYWAMTTLTTVGYGDVTPSTPLGKAWAMLTMITGLCILALPVAIISTGFAQEANRHEFVVTWSMMSRIPILADLDSADVAQIMPLLQANTVPPNAEIMSADTMGEAMYFIAGGSVKLIAKDRERTFETGDFFGAVALLDHDVSPGKFVASRKARLLKLYREDFHRLEAINPLVGAHIRRVASERRAQRDGSTSDVAPHS